MKNKRIIQDIQKVVNFFRIDLIDKMAKATQFIQRERKLSALTFLGMFTFGLVSRPDASLAQLVSIGKEVTPNFSMTPDGRERCTIAFKDFIKKLPTRRLTFSKHCLPNLCFYPLV